MIIFHRYLVQVVFQFYSVDKRSFYVSSKTHENFHVENQYLRGMEPTRVCADDVEHQVGATSPAKEQATKQP